MASHDFRPGDSVLWINKKSDVSGILGRVVSVGKMIEIRAVVRGFEQTIFLAPSRVMKCLNKRGNKK